jgi:nitrous oxidase accessory protein
MRVGIALAAALLLVLLGAWSAAGQQGQGARILHVRPGQDALARAIARADAGDTLRIHRGRYRESVEIDKPLTLVGVGKRRPVIDARCDSLITVAVQTSGVVLERLRIVGATDSFDAGREIDFRGAASGIMEDLRLRDTCDSEYGVNLVESGAVSVLNSRARGFSDAGIYVGEISDTGGGTLLVSGNETDGNNKGIIVEASTGSISVVGNKVHHNTLPGVGEQVGIFVNGSDGVTIAGNSVRRNGSVGIHLTAEANGNVLNDNSITRNPLDIRNEGAGNCGSGNSFSTGGPLSPC